ncbi:LuxR family transcriptional regulator [Nocardioides pacificus]
MEQYGPEERELFETAARDLYEHVLTSGPIEEDSPRISEGGPDRAAFELLRELGLLVFEAATGCYVATDPSAAQARVVTPLGQQGAELLQESSQWAMAFNSLSQTWRRAPHPAMGSITELRVEAINPFLTSLVRDAEWELLTAQPQAGRAAALETALQRDIAALERGVQMRTLYQHAARRNSQTHKYVSAVTERGAEVRTLDEFFNRLIVVDRRVAVIPGHEGLYVALAIRDPSLVAYLVDMFDRHWERARPFTNRETSMMKDIAAEQRAMTIRMLIEGHADPASAKRLGVSPRTYAGYISDLKEEYEAQTRFQLGYAMGSQGVSGQERAPEEE